MRFSKNSTCSAVGSEAPRCGAMSAAREQAAKTKRRSRAGCINFYRLNQPAGEHNWSKVQPSKAPHFGRPPRGGCQALPKTLFSVTVITMSDVRDSVIRAAIADMINAVTALKQNGDEEISQALKYLVERVLACEIVPQTRQEILENLVFVGQQALMRPEQRKRGVVKAALAYVK